MKKINEMFQYLYMKQEKEGVWTNEHRQFGHGFIASIIATISIFVVAHIMNYAALWFMVGIPVGLISAFLAAVVWESIQDRDPDKRFSWRDVWASNLWFIPLWFFYYGTKILGLH